MCPFMEHLSAWPSVSYARIHFLCILSKRYIIRIVLVLYNTNKYNICMCVFVYIHMYKCNLS